MSEYRYSFTKLCVGRNCCKYGRLLLLQKPHATAWFRAADLHLVSKPSAFLCIPNTQCLGTKWKYYAKSTSKNDVRTPPAQRWTKNLTPRIKHPSFAYALSREHWIMQEAFVRKRQTCELARFHIIARNKTLKRRSRPKGFEQAIACPNASPANVGSLLRPKHTHLAPTGTGG